VYILIDVRPLHSAFCGAESLRAESTVARSGKIVSHFLPRLNASKLQGSYNVSRLEAQK